MRFQSRLSMILCIMIACVRLLVYSRTSIIRPNKNGRVPQTRMRIAAVTMETCLIDHVALLFINKVGGSRSGLSITYPAGTKVSG